MALLGEHWQEGRGGLPKYKVWQPRGVIVGDAVGDVERMLPFQVS